MRIEFKVNGKSCQVDVPGAKRLLDVLREDLRFTGTKEGCGEGECGACSVLIRDEVVNSCLIPVAQVEGEAIVTVEGLEQYGADGLQAAFVEHGAAQCGICTPGMLISAHAFCQQRQREGRSADRIEIREALAGNLCRCTGYQKIVDAVAEAMAGSEIVTPVPPAPRP